ncbi:minichromosome maintenance protein 5 [Fusarium oxysporum f. sp. lycopersici 4287]|uniref:DNA replication licensing factor MCM5 n=1 Tax=Fusarium oxysporum f. sp. lycopersici (strain 4287 / CBS 123668 / FGSC 9935 / NRRL 34936) TaxID=426428 RepID=A0A0J9UEK6_FUSO4|nr:minichromosome maintenance protein 5 [Fusarium oxysporum f. sp. lycopersici 4287]KNA97257.1 minichromosome maintenance protein 5 [Fusarium oxysporum f. sp. lycopersici 4287]
MDRGSIYSAHVYEPSYAENGDTRMQLQTQLETFILDFRLDNNFVYRDQLRENALLKRYFCDVNINDLISFNEELAHRLTSEPAEIIPLPKAEIPDHQLLLHSNADDVSIRNLDSVTIARLVRVPGIVIGASVMSSKATGLHIQCRNCGHTQNIPVLGGFTGVTLPRQCARSRVPNDPTPKCPLDPYFVVHEKSGFVDQQIIKLQEAPDQVPVGELPRHVLISADRYLTNRVVPGSRCTVMGIFSIYQNKASKNSSNGGAVAIRTPYLRAVGIQTDIDQAAKGNATFSEEEEQEFLELSRRPDIYNVMADCIAPSIYGNRDIKKAILCLLLGGSKKILPDGMKLRGDINVLLLGDPGTAKSQLLKFVEKAAPISIYTSGKGSSAAGLTASVQRDQSTREFYLEGGAMVLADGGVVCIDEFDKMRDEDRVAIHEAMEQQTISIAKAGITTILNARTSDDHSREKDETMAKHVLSIQMNGRGAEDMTETEIPIDKMRRYITYCKTRCAPRLSSEAAEKLSSHFVSIRRQVHAAEMEANTRSSIPITVRQLEAIVRITESLAKLTLSPIATEVHVDEAIRLFLCSTMDAVNQGSNQGSRELNDEVNRLETELKRRLPIGWSTSLSTLRREMVEGKGYSEQALNRALMVLQRRDTIMFRNQGAQVYRNGA